MGLMLLWALPAAADSIEDAPSAAPHFTGRWLQGATLRGSVQPGSKIRFGEREVSVAPDGRFVIGLAFDAPPAAALDVIDPAGVAQRFEYTIAPRVYDVQKIGGLPKAMVEPPPELLERIESDQKLVGDARRFDTPRLDFASSMRWPVSAEVTGVYGSNRILNGVPRQPHFGVDLAAPEGAPIHATAGGIVRLARADLYYTGGTIILDHGHGLSTTYLHLSKLAVAVGQEVAAGAVIGKVGKTGRATGPHLCWRANWFDVRLDPSLLLQNEPAKKGERKK
ncbi:MAG: M23 family metallopeptidase [Panacagrimonas sp.]